MHRVVIDLTAAQNQYTPDLFERMRACAELTRAQCAGLTDQQTRLLRARVDAFNRMPAHVRRLFDGHDARAERVRATWDALARRRERHPELFDAALAARRAVALRAAWEDEIRAADEDTADAIETESVN